MQFSNTSLTAVEFPIKLAAVGKPFGGIEQMAALMLFGIHSTNCVLKNLINYCKELKVVHTIVKQ